MYENKALSYYGILDIKNVATDNDIKGAYYKRAKEFHPDGVFREKEMAMGK